MMNERIKQLAKQSGIQMFEDKSFGWSVLAGTDNNLKKFAELIIRECAKFCEHESNDDEHDDYDMGMWVKAESIKTAIVEHFGVK